MLTTGETATECQFFFFWYLLAFLQKCCVYLLTLPPSPHSHHPFSHSIWARQALGLMVTCSPACQSVLGQHVLARLGFQLALLPPSKQLHYPASKIYDSMNKSSCKNQPSIKNFHFPLNTDFKVFFLEIRMMYQMPRKSTLSLEYPGSL